METDSSTVEKGKEGHQMLKGQRKEIDENSSEMTVQTYGVHLASMRLTGVTAALPVL